ncbi:MAG: hypothetical protein WC127_08070 [Acidaminococcaceae bacterium]
MSVIMTEQLKAGIILGDNENGEYIYMPGSEIGAENPMCIFEKGDHREDLHLEEAVALAKRLSLTPVKHPKYGKKAY